MVTRSTARTVVEARCTLGEGPTWDAAGGRLLWLDIDSNELHEWAADHHRVTTLEQRATAVVPTAAGGLAAVVGTSVTLLDDDGRVGATIAELPPAGDGVANDARCDPHGRLWVGTVDRSGERRAGLFVVSIDGHVRRAMTGCGLSNGLDWSPDGATCYFADTFAHRVHRLHLGDDGLPEASSIHLETELLPDGISVDADGGVWVAFWDGGAVHRYTPDGLLDHIVDVPSGGFVTSCAFGGIDLATMFVTTATGGDDEQSIVQHPRAGALFAADVGVCGRGYTPFG
jgi:sugar lactone lactonase YvrE